MNRHRLSAIIIGTFMGVISLFAQKGQTGYQPTPENIQARKEFSDNKLGIFLHWGIYSMFGQGEWYMQNAGIDCHEYAKAAAAFYPAHFNAHDWVSAIKASGAKYICITTRHHDGFSMFDTQFSDYDIMDATPFKRDIIKELAEECQKQDIKLHLYYSHLDWTREDYYPLGSTGQNTGRTKHSEWNTYRKFMLNQLTELLNNYGPIGAIWFDGAWDQWNVNKDFDWHLDEQYALIHRIQPACLIGNNHHLHPLDGEDFQMFERDLPGENKSGYSPHSKVGKLPLETCETMNSSWGYCVKDQNYKSVTELIRLLVRAAGKGANLLMNIGPQPDGRLPEQAIDRLKGIGTWMNKYGETVYGTSKGCTENAEWGTTTRKGEKLYVHILTDKMLEHIVIPIKEKVKKVTCFEDNTKLKFTQKNGQLNIHTANCIPQTDCILSVVLK